MAGIAQNLAERIVEARANNWLGEVEGLQVSLDAARRKLVDLDRLGRTTTAGSVDLGMPVILG